ncbi:UbiA prenyltransferase family protein [Apiospora arundinis]
MSYPKHLAAGYPSAAEEKQRQAESFTIEFPSRPPTPLSQKKSPFTTILGGIRHELNVSERLLRSNAVGFLFIFLGGLLARFIRAPPPTLAEGIRGTVITLALDLLCSYVFEVCNQATSPEEDFLNKPYRPIPAGLLTVAQLKTRWALAWTLGPLALLHFFGPWAMTYLLAYEATIAFCYVWPGWLSWILRNLFVAQVYFFQVRLLNQVLGHAVPVPGWDFDLLIDFAVSVWFLCTIHVQEFHDLEGDRESGRVTLPALLSPRGLRFLRAGTALYTVVFAVALAFVGYQRISEHILVVPMSLLQLGTSAFLAYRVWASNSPQMDKVTYHVYYYIPALFILLELALVTK